MADVCEYNDEYSVFIVTGKFLELSGFQGHDYDAYRLLWHAT
jgi:hypothetical protein